MSNIIQHSPEGDETTTDDAQAAAEADRLRRMERWISTG